MSISVLAPLEMHGTDSCHLESFLSILNRTADAYKVSTARVMQLLAGMFDHPIDVRSIDTHVRLLGYSTFTERIVSTYYSLTARTLSPFDGVSGTLLPLRGVLAWNGTGIFAAKSAWCPICLDPERGVEYKMLAHELAHVRHCPLHGVPLIRSCMRCGKPRHPLCSGSEKAHCAYCRTPLWTQAAAPLSSTPYEVWAESQALKLIEYVARPDRRPPPEDWYEKFVDGLKNIRWLGTGYSSKERSWLIKASERKPYGLKSALPRWETLLRVASIQSVDAIDLICDPISFLSPKLFNDENVNFPKRARKNTPRKRFKTFEARLDQLLAADSNVVLPSVSSLARESRVSIHNATGRSSPSLAKYRVEVKCRKEYRKMVGFHKAFEVASVLVKEKDTVNIREDGAEVAKKAGVSKCIAESALHSALAWRYTKLVASLEHSLARAER